MAVYNLSEAFSKLRFLWRLQDSQSDNIKKAFGSKHWRGEIRLMLIPVLAITVLLSAGSGAAKSAIFPDLSKYKDYSAVVLEKRLVYKVKKQRLPEFVTVEGNRYFKTEKDIDLMENDLTIEEYRKIALLSDKGIKMFGDYESDIYNKDDGFKLEAEVLLSGGKKVKVKNEHIHEIKIGKDLRQTKISFPLLEKNCIIKTKVVRKIKLNVFYGDYGDYQIAEKVPVIDACVVYTVPSFYDLKFTFYPRDFLDSHEMLKTEEDGLTTYKLELKNLSIPAAEPYMPQVLQDTPRFFYILGTDTEQPITYGGMRYPVLFGPIGYLSRIYYGKTNQKLEEKISEYIKNKRLNRSFPSYYEKINAVLAKFNKEFEITDKNVKWKNNLKCMEKMGGTYFNAASLLGRIFSHLGFEVVPVFVLDRNHNYKNEKIKDFRRLTRLILFLKGGRYAYWIDPSLQFAAANQLNWDVMGLTGRGVFVDGTTREIRIPGSAASQNESYRAYYAELNANGDLVASVRWCLTGQLYLKLKGLMNEENGLEDYMQRVYEGLEGARVEMNNNCYNDRGDSLFIDFRIKWPAYARVLANMIYFDMRLLTPKTLFEMFRSDERKYDIEFAYPVTITSTLEMKIPEGYIIKSGEDTTMLEKDYMSYQKEVCRDNNILKINIWQVISAASIPAGRYQEMKAFLKTIHDADRSKIVIKKSDS